MNRALTAADGRPEPPPGPDGAIAQLGERLNGIQEVGGSIPPGSTITPVNALIMRPAA